MNDFDILKILEDLFIIVYMLESLKKNISKEFYIYINEIEKNVLVSFNIIFEKFERTIKNES